MTTPPSIPFFDMPAFVNALFAGCNSFLAELAKSAPPAPAEAPKEAAPAEPWPRVFVDLGGTCVFRGEHENEFYAHNGDRVLIPSTLTCSHCIAGRRTELTGEAKAQKLRELGCTPEGVYVGKEKLARGEWPKVVGVGKTMQVGWVFRSETDGDFWFDHKYNAAAPPLNDLLGFGNTIVDTPESRAFLAANYDAQGNRLVKPAEVEKSKVRVFIGRHGPSCVWVMRGEDDGDFLSVGRFVGAAAPSRTSLAAKEKELPPAEVPAWLEANGYNQDGTRKAAPVESPKPAPTVTPVDEELGVLIDSAEAARRAWWESGEAKDADQAALRMRNTIEAMRDLKARRAAK